MVQPTGGTPDLLNACSNLVNGVPNTAWGFQYPRTGNGFAGFVWDYSEGCEYLTGKFSSPLSYGQKYCVEFYVNLADHSFYAFDRIRAYISVDSIQVSTYGYLHFIPQVENSAGNIITDTLNWTLISGEYIAKGGEQFITIGNFRPDSLVDYIKFDTTVNSCWPYYFLDDVSVTLCDTTDTVGIKNYNNTTTPVVGKIYPNPTKDEAYLDFQIKDGQKGELQFFSVTGKLLSEYQLNSESSKIIINTATFRSGIYFYKIIVDQTVVANEKLVIIK